MFDPVPVSDSMIILFFGTLVLGSAFFSEKMAVTGKVQPLVSRKVLHAIAIGSSALVGALVENVGFLILLSVILELIILYLVIVRNYFSANGKKGWGVVYFPLVFIALLLFFPNDRFMVVAPMGLLSIADFSATLFGERFSQNFFNLTGDRKSIIGSAAFFIASLVWFIILGCFGHGQGITWLQYILMALSIGIVAVAIEAISSFGRSNLLIPSVTALILWSVFKSPAHTDVYYMFIWVIVFASGAVIAFRNGWINETGSLLAFLIGFGIVVIGKFSIIPILIFFLSGVLLNKLPGKPQSDYKYIGPKDGYQVFANGIIPCALACINGVFPDGRFEILYIAACAIAASDTISSEVGSRWGVPTFDFPRFRKIPAGVSGGVSVLGLAAGMFGACIIAAFTPQSELFIGIVAAAMVGNLLDSAMGSLVQIRYISQDGIITDTQSDYIFSGFEWVNNDIVNLFSVGITVILLAYFL